MKILITGGNGFLGKNLTFKLSQQGHEVKTFTSRECDLTQQGAIEALKHDTYDQIYHLAAWTQAGDFCRKRSGEQWIINNRINTNVLAWWQQCQPQAKLIALGTSVSYTTEDNLSEDVYMEGDPKPDYYAYAMSKRMLYAGLKSLSKQFGLRYLYLVPSTLYGPSYHTDGRQLHFIYDLIRKILRGKIYGESVTLWGDGYQRRELVYVTDFVSDMIDLGHQVHNDIVNIGAGVDYSIRDFAQHICKFVDFDFSRISFDSEQFVGAKSKILNITKLNHLLPHHSQTPLSKGLKNTIEWMQQQTTLHIA